MAAVLAGENVEQEYLWTCTLSGASKEYSWAPETVVETKENKDSEEKDVKPGHRLLIKSAILMPTAKDGEVSIVQVESEGYKEEKVIAPMVAMKGGKDYQRYVDILIPTNAKLKLIQGEGPLHLVGSHCVDFYGYRGDENAEDSDEDSEEEEAVENKEEAKKELESLKEVGKSGDVTDKKTPTKDAEKGVKEDSGSKKRKASSDAPKSGDKKKKPSQ